jgi:hypothetical protein
MASNQVFEVKITGIDEIERGLRNLDAKLQSQILRKAIKEASGPLVKTAQRLAPVLDPKGKFIRQRIPGMLKGNIRLIGSKVFKPSRGYVGYFIGSGLRKGQGAPGRRNPRDTYYWVFQERPLGRYVVPGRKATSYLQPAVDLLGEKVVQDIVDATKRFVDQENSKK